VDLAAGAEDVRTHLGVPRVFTLCVP
jgi:hypothetical protein